MLKALEIKVPDIQPTVLTVDDNDTLRYSVARCLKDGGYNVTEARTGTEALRLAQQNPALITLGINLPDMDGFEVWKKFSAVRHANVGGVGAQFIKAEGPAGDSDDRGTDFFRSSNI
jgi:response regulator RpfG family c-di-GMP phosphodiesterase